MPETHPAWTPGITIGPETINRQIKDLRQRIMGEPNFELCRGSPTLSPLVETLVAFPFASSHYFFGMTAARERINLALKVLRSRHNPQLHVTATDVYALKSCVRGDVTGRSVYEIATAVIRAELDREQRETAWETARAKSA